MKSLPGFERNAWGQPRIGTDATSAFAFAHLIRLTEERILDLFSKGLLSGTTHTCLGQELCQMSVARAMDENDAILSNHRNHGHFLTYSGDFQGLIAEVLGREGGTCGGRGGSQHLAWRHFHSNGVQAGLTAIGCGLALERKRKGAGIVAVTIGDGTLGQGLVYESLNLASLRQLPMLFVIEHNRIAQTTATSETIAGTIEGRAAAFGLPYTRLDDSAPNFLLFAEQIVNEVRTTGAPQVLIIDTKRLGPHSKGDDLRHPTEMELIRARDPLTRMGQSLEPTLRAVIEARNQEFLETICEAALASPEATIPAEETRTVFAMARREPDPEPRTTWTTPETGNVRRSLNLALTHLVSESPKATIIGEDLHDPYGGAFKVTAGVSTNFADQLISTPICEAAIAGLATGIAMAGGLPIAEVMFADFLSLQIDQLYNQAVKFPAVFPEIEIPLTIRTPAGGGRGYGPTHSQCPENIAVAIPGLTVIYPSHRHDSGELLVRAVRDWRWPKIFFEHKLLYSLAQSAADYMPIATFGEPASRLFPTLLRQRDNADATIVTYGGMLPIVEQAAAQLESHEEITVRIVVPSLLSPLPRRALWEALKNEKRIIVAEETIGEYGVGAEIGSMLLERGFRNKFTRVATPPVPILSARSLESSILPGKETIIDAVLSLF
jgi:2-oxoisovalerate dehydrogenase E1 component